MLSPKYVPSIALSLFCPVHSSYKEANLIASRNCGKQLSLPSAKDFFPLCLQNPLLPNLSVLTMGINPAPGMTEGLF